MDQNSKVHQKNVGLKNNSLICFLRKDNTGIKNVNIFNANSPEYCVFLPIGV